MKQKRMKKLGSFLLAGAMVLTMFPTFHTEVHAAGNQLPAKEKFATVEELKKFNTNNNDGETNAAKVYFGDKNHKNKNHKWWIAGSQNADSMTLFAESPLAMPKSVTDSGNRFELNQNQDKTYSEDWNCDYTGGTAPTDVYPNHYGASPLRTTLKDLESSYFTSKEQDLMKDTTVYTEDAKNKSVYSTTNKLYLAYGDYDDDHNQYVTVGKNASDNLNNGLRIDKAYWGYYYFWLRTPYNPSNKVLIVNWDCCVALGGVAGRRELVPAFELDLSSVIFASAAPAASSDGALTLQNTQFIGGDGAFTLRYKSENLGSALVSYDKSKVTLTGVPNDTYLVVQNSSKAWAKKITNETIVTPSEVDSSLKSFENCKVWLETTDSNERMTYATLADEELGTAINITASEGLNITSNNGVQEVAPNTAITDITVKVTDGYYLPEDYMSNLQSQLNGLSVAETDNGFKISGTPTSDVNITLPAATVLPKADTPQVTISKTATSITATVTNHKTEFGDIEYKWNDGNWEQDKNTLSNLQADTTYKLAVRFTGNGFYQMSDEYSVEITTLEDGNFVIVVPANLTVNYEKGLTLSKVELSNAGWTWENPDTPLSVGTASYPAVFDTTSYESTYDFSNVDGYDAVNHKVKRDVQVNVKKVKNEINITANTGLNITSNNGNQEVAIGAQIAEVTVEVTDGYYLPEDYISSLQSQLNNGLSVAETNNGFTISGTPTSDVTITLPVATPKPVSGSGSGGGSTAKLNPVYRAYNPNNGEHLYTLDEKEYKHVTSIGWQAEDVAFMAEEEKNGQALYRVYNPNSGLHHYTLDENEKNTLVSLGWHDEKVAWYTSKKPQSAPVFRVYNPNDGNHHYTMNKQEKDVLVSLGWHDEGLAFRTAPIEK